MHAQETYLVGPTFDGLQIVPASVDRVGLIIHPAAQASIGVTPFDIGDPLANLGYTIIPNQNESDSILRWSDWGPLIQMAWYQRFGGALAGYVIWEIFGDPRELVAGIKVPSKLETQALRSVKNGQYQKRTKFAACDSPGIRRAVDRAKRFAARLDSERAADK